MFLRYRSFLSPLARHLSMFSAAACRLSILSPVAIPLLAGCAALGPGHDSLPAPDADSTATLQSSEAFEAVITKTVQCQYLLFLPNGYGEDTRRWPLIFFLHGAGERGDDLVSVRRHGPPKLIDANPGFPFIVVSPQCPKFEYWPTDMLGALLDHVVQQYAVDTDRIYLTGLSMGGYGTWKLAIEHPDRFAAIAPICGGGDPRKVAVLKDVPVWAFHGARDTIVLPSEGEDMVNALRAAGGNVRFTLYPDAAHDSWTRTYRNPLLYEWFLEHKRGAPKTP